ncbi:ester cyclase [Amycolatopsis sp. cmx-4-54]|uniref:ester cyclase n=1 Tax=Amycolatopsis sp. cmx-4-54 TaxID=2790936 RepID=UPI003979E8B0
MSDTTMSEAATVIRRFYDTLSTGDLTLVDAVLAPGWEAVPALSIDGPEGWKATVTYLRTALSDLELVIEDVVVDGDRVAVSSTCRGVHTGELLGVAGTGRQVEFQAIDVHRLEHGRIVWSRHLEDHFGLAHQLGLTFTPAS